MCPRRPPAPHARPQSSRLQSPWMARVIEELRAAIEASGLTPYELAKRSGVDRSQIYRLQQGARSVGVDTLEKLCAELGIEVVLKKKRGK